MSEADQKRMWDAIRAEQKAAAPNLEQAERARKAGMPEWMQEMSEAVPTSLVQDIVADGRRSMTPSSLAKSGPEPKKGTGWQEEIPLKPAPGIGLVDQLV